MTIRSAPVISVVIPFFHTYARYLSECLESIRTQTFTEWEAIVVDDASGTDDARAIVRRQGDSRITVADHAENRGQAAGRNTGIRRSQGPLIVPVDCDDRLAPTHFAKLCQALEDHPDCTAAYSDYRLFGAINSDVSFPVRDLPALLHAQWIPHPGTMVRRSLFDLTDGYCEDDVFRAGNEDWEYFLSLAENGLRPVRVPEPLYFYRQHEHSISNSRFALADCVMREAMYQRHRALFDSFGMRDVFLAGGYRTSGRARWVNGERAVGLQLLARAAWLSPSAFLSAGTRAFRDAVRNEPEAQPA